MPHYLSRLITQYPDFPKEGILFRDISPLLQYPEEFGDLINKMSTSEIYANSDAIISIDARGFIFGTAIARLLSMPMLVARKPGKLPGNLLYKSYSLEYGENALCIQREAIKNYKSFVIVDDLLATGGTAKCVSEILTEAGKEIAGLSVVIELVELNARRLLPFPVESQMQC